MLSSELAADEGGDGWLRGGVDGPLAVVDGALAISRPFLCTLVYSSVLYCTPIYSGVL